MHLGPHFKRLAWYSRVQAHADGWVIENTLQLLKSRLGRLKSVVENQPVASILTLSALLD